MKFAVISDIHSNYMALENALCCLDDMRRAGEGVDGVIFLGDYLTDFPHPQYTRWTTGKRSTSSREAWC